MKIDLTNSMQAKLGTNRAAKSAKKKLKQRTAVKAQVAVPRVALTLLKQTATKQAVQPQVRQRVQRIYEFTMKVPGATDLPNDLRMQEDHSLAKTIEQEDKNGYEHGEQSEAARNLQGVFETIENVKSAKSEKTKIETPTGKSEQYDFGKPEQKGKDGNKSSHEGGEEQAAAIKDPKENQVKHFFKNANQKTEGDKSSKAHEEDAQQGLPKRMRILEQHIGFHTEDSGGAGGSSGANPISFSAAAGFDDPEGSQSEPESIEQDEEDEMAQYGDLGDGDHGEAEA